MIPRPTTRRPAEVVRRYLADPHAGWSVGTLGAIAEFVREPEETWTAAAPGGPGPDAGGPGGRAGADGEIRGVVTGRGGIRPALPRDAVAVAYRTPAGPDLGWNHAVAFCVPADHTAHPGPARTVLTELGPDTAALRDRDRDAVLFDLGLGTTAVQACVRVPAGDDLCAARRTLPGSPVFTSGAAALLVGHGPHRVFRGPAGRVEVFTPIPPPDGRSPDGPHTHLLPHLLARGRTHAATVPVPAGTVPVAHLYPPHPLFDPLGRPRPFDTARDDAFAALLEEFGDPALVALESAVTTAVRAGRGPDAVRVPPSAPARATVAVTLRRLTHREPDLPALARWRPQRVADPGHRDPDGDRNGG